MTGGGGDPLPVIANASAGTSDPEVAERVREALAAGGLRSRVRVVPASEIPAAARAAARVARVVGAAGGDGTVSAAAGALAGTGTALLPIPVGTRNHFARRLGIDSPEAAARALALGRVSRVPLGSVDGRTFINHASAGFYPRLVHHRERLAPWMGKGVANVLAGAYVLLRFRTTTVILELEGVRWSRAVPGLWVGLGRGAFRLPVDGRATFGRSLELVIPRAHTRLGVLASGVRALWHLRRGRPLDLAGVEVVHARAFTLATRHAVDLSRDGEFERAWPPLEFRIHPDALPVLSLVPDSR